MAKYHRKLSRAPAILEHMGDIFHNFMQPMQALVGSADILKLKYQNLTPDEIQLYVDAIAAGASQLSTEILGAQEYLRCLREKPEAFTESRLRKYLEEAITPVALSKGIKYKLERMEIGPEKIWLPKCFILGTTMNMVTNAREANAPEIINRYALNEKYMHISFADNGEGMDEETLKRCGKRGFTTKKERGGTGSGVAFINDYMTLIGGHVEIKSERGKGTEFTLYYPLEKLLSPPAENHSPAQ